MGLPLMLIAILTSNIFAQPETMAWGNLNGIRVEGQLIEFETSLALIGSTLLDVTQTAKEKQSPRYKLDDSQETITTSLDAISFTELVKDMGNGRVELNIEAKADSDTTIYGAFLCLDLPVAGFGEAKIELIDSTASKLDPISLFNNRRWRRFSRNVQASVAGVRIAGNGQQVVIMADKPTEIIVQRGNRFFGSSNTRIYFSVMEGAATKGQTAGKIFTLTASGEIDKTPIKLVLDPRNPGREFDGIGGNFRIQDPDVDPQVIDYCLDNLNVTWGRVQMPWNNWHPVESVDPLQEARSGHLDPQVREAMLMAQRLSKMGIPIILSCWQGPRWATEGEPGFGPRPDGLRGNPLDQKKIKSIVKSITSYILYLKEAYGVEAAMFSFNESDLGINIRQTGEEHADLIKKLGGYMASQGLTTKMLLGDNSDANTYWFITPAMEDPATHKYIGAISFHSWRGCDPWTLSIWADAAKQMNVPLLVGEGSTDAAAHRYPDIFLQKVFTLNEIDMYIRILNICQSRSILQWQLTSDYSVLTGDGIYNTKGKLKPTQRFWNLKQLGLTPSGSYYLDIESNRPHVQCVAFGDIADNVYSIHMVNTGATRQVVLSGVPDSVKQLQVYTTDESRSMKKGERIQVSDGIAKFTLDKTCFTTLVSVK